MQLTGLQELGIFPETTNSSEPFGLDSPQEEKEVITSVQISFLSLHQLTATQARPVPVAKWLGNWLTAPVVPSTDAMSCLGWQLLLRCRQHPGPKDRDPPLLSMQRFSPSFSCPFPHSASPQTRHSLLLYLLNPWCQTGAGGGRKGLF